MAYNTNFLFTNSEVAGSKGGTFYNMKEVEDYSKMTSNRNCSMNNTTGSPGQGLPSETIKYSYQQIDQVKSDVAIPNPPRRRNASKYQTTVSTFARTTSDEPGKEEWKRDDAITVIIQIQHTQSEFLTEAMIGEVVDRAYSSLKHEDGNWRFNELAVGGVTPTQN